MMSSSAIQTKKEEHHQNGQRRRNDADQEQPKTTTQTKQQHKEELVIKARKHTTLHQPTRISVAPPPPKVNYKSVLCGLASGVVSAGLFNPLDRALYLSVKNRQPLLSLENFQNPYLGFFQSVGHRALSGGLYFPLEQFFMRILVVPSKIDQHHNSGALVNFLAGTAAGAMNAIIINPISAIKYKSWGRDVNRGMTTEAFEMFRKGGIRPFFNGLIPTLWRDLVFGGCYTFLRFEFQYRFQVSKEYQWTSNFFAAAIATIASGPFNLARNEQYATKSRHIADTVTVVLTNFVTETKDQPSSLQKLKFVQNRLRLGWGTVRVALGMSFANYLYDTLHEIFVK